MLAERLQLGLEDAVIVVGLRECYFRSASV
jgi:hypothetical protein